MARREARREAWLQNQGVSETSACTPRREVGQNKRAHRHCPFKPGKKSPFWKITKLASGLRFRFTLSWVGERPEAPGSRTHGQFNGRFFLRISDTRMCLSQVTLKARIDKIQRYGNIVTGGSIIMSSSENGWPRYSKRRQTLPMISLVSRKYAPLTP